MAYLHKTLVASCVSLALAFTFSCSLDDIIDDKSSSSGGYPTEYFQTMPLGSAGAGCLIKDYEDGDYFCKVVSTKDKCESSMDYTRYIYEPVDSCEGYSVDGWEPLHGCLILGTNGEEHTCVEVPNEAHCNKIFTNYGGSSSEFIDSCAGHGVG